MHQQLKFGLGIQRLHFLHRFSRCAQQHGFVALVFQHVVQPEFLHVLVEIAHVAARQLALLDQRRLRTKQQNSGTSTKRNMKTENETYKRNRFVDAVLECFDNQFKNFLPFDTRGVSTTQHVKPCN